MALITLNISQSFNPSGGIWNHCTDKWQWKNYAHIWKNKVCMQILICMHFQCNDEENLAMWRYIKTIKFYLYESDKRICHFSICGEERYSHQQSLTTVSRQGHIVVKVLVLRYKYLIKTFGKYIKFCIKPWRPCTIREHCRL